MRGLSPLPGLWRWLRCACAGLCFVCAETAGAAITTNLLSNPGFEAGEALPASWRLMEAGGHWDNVGRSGQRSIAVSGSGTGSSAWREVVPSTSPGAVYRIRFWGRRDAGSTGGTTISGPSRVNRDFELGADWREYGYVFRTGDGAPDFIRLGQWEVKGRVSFDDVSLVPVIPIHEAFQGGLVLGEGESVERGRYRFRPDFTWPGANVHRPLSSFTCGFNSGRWLFPESGELVFRFELGSVPQGSARVEVGIQNYAAGGLLVEAGRDGSSWTVLGRLDGAKKTGAFEIPGQETPARQVWIRLRQAGPGGYLQMAEFRYEAEVNKDIEDAVGTTHFIDVLRSDSRLAVVPLRLGAPTPDGRLGLELGITNVSDRRMVLNAGWSPGAAGTSLTDQARGERGRGEVRIGLPAGAGELVNLHTEFPAPGLRRERVRLAAGRESLWEFEVEMTSGFLARSDYGVRLRGLPGLDLWWCESGWKVGRDRAVPRSTSVRPVALSAARGEFEAVQVVLRPAQPMELLGVTVEQGGERGPDAIEARVDVVGYVRVVQPTDWSCVRGWYPDPLPPLTKPIRLAAGVNQPIWVTFRVPSGAKAGEHRGTFVVNTSLGALHVPWRITVFGFELPRDTHLRSALGLGAGSINEYHRLNGRPEAEQRAVFEGYLRNFAEHRISPYSFFDYDPIRVRFEGLGADKHAVVDFTHFDAAASRWIDGARFNTFSLPLQGMGGGTFQSRALGSLEGFQEGTPEHARLFQDYLSQVEAHLREKGWLDEAFTYWFDEPDPKDYEFVVAGMKRIKAAAPGLRRMLTEQPEPALMGHVDIWCGLTPEWTPERVKLRREAGEDVWWYICTGPKAPYVTEFIDHPGTELRLWPWQSWQYGIRGILVWATLYWNSPTAFRTPRRQDPWADPMSYVSGYDFPPGTIGHWGNGDGRFLYPPRPRTADSAAPLLDAPVNSLRWEMLRDGMEDYEYFWVLQREIDRLEKAGFKDKPLLSSARALLAVPAEVSRDLTHFTTDPRILLRHREQVARMIERLNRLH